MHETAAARPKAVLVGVLTPEVSDAEAQASFVELRRLVETLGLDVVGQVSQRRKGAISFDILGAGKLKELAAWTGGSGIIPKGPKSKVELPELDDPSDEQETPAGPRASVVVVDHELSPKQLRNLEKATNAEVLDRTGVIVEIFHRHASSREARLQVEIARLTYQAPRMRETGGSERQRGGIGGKGAGESSIELDRRKIRDRIAELRRELASIEDERGVRRARRQEQLRVALVGYTNAGKSSLMRALTGTQVLVADKLFATLDTTVRAMVPETTPRVLISDTVGFIKKLPHDLVASFRSTLDEAHEASLLLFVVDASDPDFRSQLQVTQTVLAEIGVESEVPRKLILNKSDQLSADQIAAFRAEYPEALIISSKDPAGVDTVRQAIVETFQRSMPETELLVPYDAQGIIGEIRSKTTVLEEDYQQEGVRYRVRANDATIARLEALIARC